MHARLWADLVEKFAKATAVVRANPLCFRENGLGSFSRGAVLVSCVSVHPKGGGGVVLCYTVRMF